MSQFFLCIVFCVPILSISPNFFYLSYTHISCKILKYFQRSIQFLLRYSSFPKSSIFRLQFGLVLALNHHLGFPFLLSYIDSPDFWIPHSSSLWFPLILLKCVLWELPRKQRRPSLSSCMLETSLLYRHTWLGVGNV